MSAPRTEPLMTETVFISSRMDELAMERRSAFAAVYEAGKIPILFETEPQENEIARIDALVDRADLFLGIYYETYGERSDGLCGLSPIAYELYRFIARFATIGNNPLSSTAKNEIRHNLEKKKYLKQLRNDLRVQLANRAGQLHEIFSERVRLFLRTHGSEEGMISRSLAAFLEDLPRIEFHTVELKPPVNLRPYAEKERYVAPHTDLFDKIFRRLLKSKTRTIVVSQSPRVPTPLFFCTINGDDEAGLLYRALEVCFADGFNIKDLAIRKDNPRTPANGGIEVQIILELFHAQTDREAYSSRASSLRQGLEIKTRRNVKIVELAREAFIGLREEAGMIPDLLFYYRVEAADVPGLLMTVTRLISHFGGSIEYVCYPHDYSQAGQHVYVPVIIGVEPVAADVRFAGLEGQRCMEHELRAIVGVANVIRYASAAEVRRNLDIAP